MRDAGGDTVMAPVPDSVATMLQLAQVLLANTRATQRYRADLFGDLQSPGHIDRPNAQESNNCLIDRLFSDCRRSCLTAKVCFVCLHFCSEKTQ